MFSFHTFYKIEKETHINKIIKNLKFKPYYQLINDTDEKIILYCATIQKSKKLILSEKKNEIKIRTREKLQKIILYPNEDIRIFYKNLLRVYWMNNDLVQSIDEFQKFDKIIFESYQRVKTKKPITYEREESINILSCDFGSGILDNEDISENEIYSENDVIDSDIVSDYDIDELP